MKTYKIAILLLGLFIIITSKVLIAKESVHKNSMKLSEPSFYYKTKGDYYRHLGFYNKSLEFYDKVLYLDPNNIEAFYWKAFVYAEKGLYFDAFIEIKNASRYLKKEISAHNNKLFYRFKFLESNIYFILCQKAKHQKQSIFHYNQMKRILTRLQEDIQEALSTHKIVHQSNTDNFLHTYLGETYFSQGLYLYEAPVYQRINFFKEAVSLHFKPALSYYYQFQLYQNQGNATQAYDALKNALDLNPNIVLESQTMPLIIR